MLNTVSVYKIGMRGKGTNPCCGFLLLGHWPRELSVTHPHTHKKTHTHTHENVFMHHISHHDGSAGRPWCWRSSRFFEYQQRSLCFDQERHSAQVAILCQIVPQSPFSLSAQSFCFVSQKCFISLAVWLLVFCSMFKFVFPALQSFQYLRLSLCADGHPLRLASRHLCLFCL